MRLTSLLCTALLASCATTAPGNSDQLAIATGTVAANLEHPLYAASDHDATCKVFHHVWAPDGRLLTKGLGGLFPHHHGLFLGWNKMRCRGHSFDFWHCQRGETQRFVAFVAPESCGLAADWQVAAIDWLAGDGQPVLHERRALRARVARDDSTVLDVQIQLRAASDPVQLTGDPQHAGHQFRALQQFAEKGAEPVRYVRPTTAKPQPNDVWANCAWIAAVLPLTDGPVTVLRIEGEHNPRPVLWSTRGYGRFGATFSHELLPRQPLELRYTYIVALGERDADWCERTATQTAASAD
ncbi:MAG: DUF6807 family protein [Planctomycetota bacterium]